MKIFKRKSRPKYKVEKCKLLSHTRAIVLRFSPNRMIRSELASTIFVGFSTRRFSHFQKQKVKYRISDKLLGGKSLVQMRAPK
jgi:hypothetical protein